MLTSFLFYIKIFPFHSLRFRTSKSSELYTLLVVCRIVGLFVSGRGFVGVENLYILLF